MASGTTRRVSDGSVVDFKAAQRAWAAAARPVLERVARTYNQYIVYQDLAEAVQEESGITTGVPFRHWIGSVLGALSGGLIVGDAHAARDLFLLGAASLTVGAIASLVLMRGHDLRNGAS